MYQNIYIYTWIYEYIPDRYNWYIGLLLSNSKSNLTISVRENMKNALKKSNNFIIYEQYASVMKAVTALY